MQAKRLRLRAARLSSPWVNPGASRRDLVMPEKLVEICLLAGSAHRCCETCGTPWARKYRPGGAPPAVREPAHQPGNVPTKTDSTGWHPRLVATDTWEPTCACTVNEGTGRCAVLDPFLGSGTVAKVAAEHGRAYVGIELNADYARLISARLATAQPRLWAEVGGVLPDGGHTSLLGEGTTHAVPRLRLVDTPTQNALFAPSDETDAGEEVAI